jgi:hypothetical protein
MREASFILPVVDANSTTPLGDTFARRRHSIAKARNDCVEFFNSLTITRGDGFCKDSDGAIVREPVDVYTVAGEPSYAADHELHRIAYTAAQELGERAVYIRDFEGTVTVWTIGAGPVTETTTFSKHRGLDLSTLPEGVEGTWSKVR